MKELTTTSIQWPVTVPHAARERIIHFVNEEIRRQNALEMEEEVRLPSPFQKRIEFAKMEGVHRGMRAGFALGFMSSTLLIVAMYLINLVWS